MTERAMIERPATERRRVRRMGDRALLVELRDVDEALRMHAAIERAAPAGIVDLVPAARSVLVRLASPSLARDAARTLASLPLADAVETERREVVLPVHYDGDDLRDVAGLLGVSAEEVVARHASATWRVAFMGFAPGFGYLASDEPVLDVPRRATPRTRIPAGAVGLAGVFSGVYPRESPGGWQLIGETDAVLWDLDRAQPALLAPGTVVRFERRARPSVRAAPSRTAPSIARDGAIEVVDPGAQLTVQDLGRQGLARLGVGVSGAADRASLVRANLAVGNDDGAAALECAGGGATLRLHARAVAAVDGADVPVTIVGDDGEHRPGLGEPFALEPGDELRIGVPSAGMRAILAVRGGIDVPAVLGSRSTDTLARLGPPPLTRGARVPIGDARGTRPVEPVAAARPSMPRADEVVAVRVVRGPHDDRLAAEGLVALLGTAWLVTPRSDRVGIRLDGDALTLADRSELASEGMVPGAIQVPQDGKPVVFLADHPLTGGYPVVAVVVDDDLDVLGQLPPGARVRLVADASAS